MTLIQDRKEHCMSLVTKVPTTKVHVVIKESYKWKFGKVKAENIFSQKASTCDIKEKGILFWKVNVDGTLG